MRNKLSSFGLPAETIQKIHGAFKSYPEIEQVCIYGSRAKGNYHPGSDLYQIDLNLASHKDTKPQRKNCPLCLSVFVRALIDKFCVLLSLSDNMESIK